MNTNKKTAKIVGALFLTAMAASLLGAGLVESVLSSPDTLQAVSENETLVLAGTLLELLNAIAVIGIAVLLFAYLRQHSLNIALGYLAFRIIEAVFCSMIVIAPLSLIALSQEYVLADSAQAAVLSTAGALAIAGRASVASLLIPVFFSLGALLFYTSAYQSGLLPHPLAAWGLIGAVLILANCLLQAFNPDLGTGVQMILALPIILNEIFLGFWLIVKGFNTRAASAGMAWQTSAP
jgi:hypothetical protein